MYGSLLAVTTTEKHLHKKTITPFSEMYKCSLASGWAWLIAEKKE
jgi:hypothetical protein